jgi:dipeptidyl aminopeptidase/acylaminoacyl peptidase
MFHGARDSTVSRKHFDRLLAELRKGDAPLDYLVFPDEGHVIIKRDNKLKFARRIERFLATHLGGRADAWER